MKKQGDIISSIGLYTYLCLKFAHDKSRHNFGVIYYQQSEYKLAYQLWLDAYNTPNSSTKKQSAKNIVEIFKSSKIPINSIETEIFSSDEYDDYLELIKAQSYGSAFTMVALNKGSMPPQRVCIIMRNG